MKNKNIKFAIKKINALKMLQCEKEVEKLKEKLMVDKSQNQELVSLLCEHAVLCYFCCYRRKKRYFSSPYEVLKKLSINEICDIYDGYMGLNDAQELSYNTSFETQVKDFKRRQKCCSKMNLTD